MRARMALLQAGRPFRAMEIVLRNKPAAMLALSPKGTVPVLQLGGGPVLEESLDIMRWAWQGRDADGWWSRSQSEGNLRLVACNDGAFKHHLDRCKYPERYADDPLGREGHAAAAMAALIGPLEQRLQREPCLGGATPCATDLALFPFVRQFAAVDPAGFAAQPVPAVHAWLDRWRASPLFEACMAKLPPETVVDFPALGAAPAAASGGPD